jgi:hypothetical protein
MIVRKPDLTMVVRYDEFQTRHPDALNLFFLPATYASASHLYGFEESRAIRNFVTCDKNLVYAVFS